MKNNRIHIIIATTCLVFSTGAMSQNTTPENYPNYDKRFSQAFNDCYQKAEEAVGTADYVQCANDENQRQDKRLNENYKKLMREASAADRKLLRAAQRQWIKYRDADYKLYSQYNGTDMRIFCAVRRAAQTAQRANELEILLGR